MHQIGFYCPPTVLLDRNVVQPETVAYGSAVHPARGGVGRVVPLFSSARGVQSVRIHHSIHGPTVVARTR